MIAPRHLPLVLKYISRHRTRSLLTILGVATAMFLFCAVQAMQRGVDAATQRTAEDTTLVVYRENRFCPFTSQLPENHQRTIAEVPGVRSVVPMMVVVNNCRASLDVVTFRGIPPDNMNPRQFEGLRVTDGSLEEWRSRSDAALVGSQLASRRGLRVGDQLDAAGIQVHIAGIINSSSPQDQNVAYVHLPFIQQAAGNRQGIVTQFSVLVDDPAQLDAVAAAIDAEFKTSEAPTWTAAEKAFVARAVADIMDLVHFAGWLGWGSLVAIFALVANAIVLSVHDRVKDHAVMQTLGFDGGTIAGLIVAEGLLLSIFGGVLGLSSAWLVMHLGQFAFSVEGLSVAIQTGPATLALGMGLCVAIGVLAGLVPALRAARISTAEAFRAV